jgi:hypothetical protein
MSKGPGGIERRIGELFASTRDRGLSVTEIADHAFALGGRTATRAQRLSATRAAHRLLRRMKEADARARQLNAQAHRETKAAGFSQDHDEKPARSGEELDRQLEQHRAYEAALKATEAYRRSEELSAFVRQFGSWLHIVKMSQGRPRGEREFWRATADKSGTLYFHPPDRSDQGLGCLDPTRWRDLG